MHKKAKISNETTETTLKFTHIWSIFNVFYLFEENNDADTSDSYIVPEFLQSDAFAPFNDSPCHFYLRVHSTKGWKAANSHLSLALHYKYNESLPEIEVSCSFAICKFPSNPAQPKLLNTQNVTGKLTMENDSIGTNEFILIDELFNLRRGYVQANGSLQINCLIEINSFNLPSPKKSLSSKSVSSAWVSLAGQLTHRWCIPNFSYFLDSQVHVLSSNDFASKEETEKCNLKDWQLFLRLWPKGRDIDNPEHLSLFLYILAPIESRRKAQYQMSLMNAQNAECFTKQNQVHLHSFKNEFGYSRYIDCQSLRAQQGSFIFQDQLNISCKVKMIEDIFSWQVEAVESQNQNTDGKMVNLNCTFKDNNITNSMVICGSTTSMKNFTATSNNLPRL